MPTWHEVLKSTLQNVIIIIQKGVTDDGCPKYKPMNDRMIVRHGGHSYFYDLYRIELLP